MIKKISSILMSFMIVLASISFAISLNSESVFAADEVGCCVYDENTGDYCSENVDSASCAGGSFYSGISCSQITPPAGAVSPCEKGTCVEDSGFCSASKFRKQCVDEGGEWYDEELNSVDFCSQGCCQILNDEQDTINQYSVIFGQQCVMDSERLGLNYIFNPGECAAQEEQLGCCITDFSCGLTTSPECTGGFNAGTLCSDSQFSDYCSCGEPTVNKCYQGSVWSFNECNEPVEEISVCDIGSEICKVENGEAVCADSSCEIALTYTSLTYDTAFFNSGEVGVQYEKEDGTVEIGKIQVNDDKNRSIVIPSGGSACVQYQGPGETHIVYSCNLGRLGKTPVSVFNGREKICEYNFTSGEIGVRENDYKTCGECSDIAGRESGSGFYKVMDWLSALASAGGWNALDVKMWDYWVAGPGECDSGSSCKAEGDCVQTDHNWCAPKYPVDNFQSCGLFTDSRSGSPYDKLPQACQSYGSCELKQDREVNMAASVLICFTNVAVGKLSNTVISGIGDKIFGDELDKVIPEDKQGEAKNAATGNTENVEPPAKAKWTSDLGKFASDYLGSMGSFLKQIVTIGGAINWNDLDLAGKRYFINVNYLSNRNQVDEQYVNENIEVYSQNGETYWYDKTNGFVYQLNSQNGDLTRVDPSSTGIVFIGPEDELIGPRPSPGNDGFRLSMPNNLFFGSSFTKPLFAPSPQENLDVLVPYYGRNYYDAYTGEAKGNWKEATDWWKDYFGNGALLWEVFSQQLTRAGINIVTEALFAKFGGTFLPAAQYLSLQYWTREFVCTWAAGPLGFIPGVKQACKDPDFLNFLSCTIIHSANQATYNAGICVAADLRESGYSECYRCNEDGDVRDCTIERCRGLGTDCEPYTNSQGKTVCDVSDKALQKCEETINSELTITTDLTGVHSLAYEDYYYELDIETSKFSSCRYTTNPSQEFSAWTKFEEEDRAGLHHSTGLWAGDPLINNYKYYIQCEWGCDADDWGSQFSPAYEFNIVKQEKLDSEPPVIIDSYPYPAQLLESTNSVTMWVRADEELVSCKFAPVNLTNLQDETIASVQDQVTGTESDEQIDTLIENEFLNSDFMNPQNEMTRVAADKFETVLTDLQYGETYLYSVVCEDTSGPQNQNRFSRPKLMLFKVSNPFEVVITDPETGSRTSKHIDEIKVSTSIETECKYSFDTKLKYEEMSAFVETGGRAHITGLTEALRSGEYNLYVSCVNFDTLDLASGMSNFIIEPDLTAPKLVKLVSAGGRLTIKLDEYGTCTYSDEGFTEEQADMVTVGTGLDSLYTEFTLQQSGANRYYISCKDIDENTGSYIVYP